MQRKCLNVKKNGYVVSGDLIIIIPITGWCTIIPSWNIRDLTKTSNVAIKPVGHDRHSTNELSFSL